MNTITTINLTQHEASPEQLLAGVVEIEEGLKSKLLGLLNFEGVPTSKEVWESADGMAEIMKHYDPDLTSEVEFMVGGHPALMGALVEFVPIYQMKFAASDRVSKEIIMEDGSVKKVSVFKHLGFTYMLYPRITL